MSDFDAIIIGSGMSGGWVAKELSERGLKVLVLERGKEIVPERDYKDTIPKPDRPNLDWVAEDELEEHYPIQRKVAGYAINTSSKQYFIKDSENPYEVTEGSDFRWMRASNTGGRSVLWWRQSWRFSDFDFGANANDGIGIDWPVRYDDIKPWYDYVERFAGIAGNMDGLPQVPDGVFQPPFAMTPPEELLRDTLKEHFPTRHVIQTRTANLTAPTDEQLALGRGQCQSRMQCYEGCSFKAYFSSLNATLPAAMNTGNCTIVNDAIVHSIDYDADANRVTGVKVIDQKTKETSSYTAKLIFVNASAVASAMILLQSKSEAFQNGLANSSGQVGRNLMDHISSPGVSAISNKNMDVTTFGRRPNGVYIPRYGNVTEMDKPYKRGFCFQMESHPVSEHLGSRPGLGREFKEAHRQPGPWKFNARAVAPVLPDNNNSVSLHPSKVDQWGLPLALFHTEHQENELILMQEAQKDIVEMFEKAGFTDIVAPEIDVSALGNEIHEMGTARMGEDPTQSVLNKWNQAHDVPNLFITDGSFMNSASTQNPSLTYMAFSARAAQHAADLLGEGAL